MASLSDLLVNIIGCDLDRDYDRLAIDVAAGAVTVFGDSIFAFLMQQLQTMDTAGAEKIARVLYGAGYYSDGYPAEYARGLLERWRVGMVDMPMRTCSGGVFTWNVVYRDESVIRAVEELADATLEATARTRIEPWVVHSAVTLKTVLAKREAVLGRFRDGRLVAAPNMLQRVVDSNEGQKLREFGFSHDNTDDLARALVALWAYGSVQEIKSEEGITVETSGDLRSPKGVDFAIGYAQWEQRPRDVLLLKTMRLRTG